MIKILISESYELQHVGVGKYNLVIPLRIEIESDRLAPALYKDEKLSERELEVLQLIGKGLSNQEIAALLCISAHTIDAHLCTMRRKLNATSVRQLISFAFKKGLVPLDEL